MPPVLVSASCDQIVDDFRERVDRLLLAASRLPRQIAGDPMPSFDLDDTGHSATDQRERSFAHRAHPWINVINFMGVPAEHRQDPPVERRSGRTTPSFFVATRTSAQRGECLSGSQ